MKSIQEQTMKSKSGIAFFITKIQNNGQNEKVNKINNGNQYNL